MSGDEDRHSLADQQARLVEALISDAAAPEGFDAGQVALTARTLHQKRARAVAKSWPAVADGLGANFGALFESYAAAQPLPTSGAVDDGMGFATWLKRQNLLDDAGCVQWLLHRAARGWPIRTVRLSRTRRLTIAVRIPALGVLLFSIPRP
jgi:hypothetical protein